MNDGEPADEPDVPVGPVDVLVVELPAGRHSLDAAAARELVSLVDAEMVRVLDLVVVDVLTDGQLEVHEVRDLAVDDGLRALDGNVATVLTPQELAELVEGAQPGSRVGVVVWEHVWAAPFLRAAADGGGRVVANDRFPAGELAARIGAVGGADGRWRTAPTLLPSGARADAR